MLNYLTINSFANFTPNKAKQFVPCSYDGYVIGDGILFYLEADELLFVGRAPTVNWIEFHGKTGGFKVDLIRDDRSPSHPRGNAVIRRHYRYQIQGPNAAKVLEKVNGGPIPGREVLHHGCHKHRGPQGARAASRHGGRSGTRDLGPLRAARRNPRHHIGGGPDFGMTPVGSRAYASNTLESGWIPSPLPAVYTGEKMKKYREWLPANGYEGTGSIGGSFVAENIEAYYLTPYELGYGPFVKFDHDFIGREALEKKVKEPHAARK